MNDICAKKKLNVDKKENNIKAVHRLAFVYILVSFLGWVCETIGCLIFEKSFNDRGFLLLPFCFIYGSVTLLTYLLFETPLNGRIYNISKKIFPLKSISILFSFIIYFILSFFTASIIEYGISYIFDKIFGVRLWYYEGYAANLNGYVCLPFSLLWGFLLTFAMAFLWESLLKITEKISLKSVKFINTIVFFAAALDFVFNLIYLFKTGQNFIINEFFKIIASLL